VRLRAALRVAEGESSGSRGNVLHLSADTLRRSSESRRGRLGPRKESAVAVSCHRHVREMQARKIPCPNSPAQRRRPLERSPAHFLLPHPTARSTRTTMNLSRVRRTCKHYLAPRGNKPVPFQRSGPAPAPRRHGRVVVARRSERPYPDVLRDRTKEGAVAQVDGNPGRGSAMAR